MKYFFDSSALVKRYLPEIGTAWVQSTIRNTSQTDLYIASVTGAEIMAAFARKLRSGEIASADYHKVTDFFEHHFRSRYVRLRLSLSVIHLAMELTKRHPLRGYDAVQLAAALTLRDILQKYGIMDLTFVSADDNLCHAASDEGLMVENPNYHP